MLAKFHMIPIFSTILLSTRKIILCVFVFNLRFNCLWMHINWKTYRFDSLLRHVSTIDNWLCLRGRQGLYYAIIRSAYCAHLSDLNDRCGSEGLSSGKKQCIGYSHKSKWFVFVCCSRFWWWEQGEHRWNTSILKVLSFPFVLFWLIKKIWINTHFIAYFSTKLRKHVKKLSIRSRNWS